MSYCPFISFGKERNYEIQCMGYGCELWDSDNECCLIKTALEKFIGPKENQIEELVHECNKLKHLMEYDKLVADLMKKGV